MHYKDLADCDYFSPDAHYFKAVGWLSKGHEFTTGEVAEAVFGKLCELLVNPWNPVYSAGIFSCEWCRFTGGSGTGNFKSYKISGISKACLLVPGDGVIYVSPESITHYIDAHGYAPPAEFCEAVMQCPPMRSVAYHKAILANGGREMVRRFNELEKENKG